MGLDFIRWPSYATYLYLFNKAHPQELWEVLQARMIMHVLPGVERVYQLVCDGKTLRGAAIKTYYGNHLFAAHVTVYA